MEMQELKGGEGHFEASEVGSPRNRFARVLPDYQAAAMRVVADPYTNNSLDSRDVSTLDAVQPGMSGEFLQMANDFAAPRFSSYVGSRQSGGQYADYDKESEATIAALSRGQTMDPLAPGARYSEVDDAIKFTSYNVEVKGAARVIPDQSRANEDSGGQLLGRAVRFLTEMGLRDLETRLHSAVGAKGDWALSADGAGSVSAGFDFADDSKNNVVKWSAANSDPIKDVLDAVVAVAGRTGKRPNALLLGADVWSSLLTHSKFVTRVSGGQTTGAAMVTRQIVATLLGLDRVEVSWAVNAQGKFLFEKTAIVAYVPQTKSMNDPSAIMRVGWTGLNGAAADGTSIRTVRRDDRDADIVQARTAWAIVRQSRYLGVYFNSIV